MTDNPGQAIDGRIPVLDVGPHLRGEAGADCTLARAIDATARDTGFLVIAGHGVPQPKVERTFAEASRFFDLDLEQKLALKVGAYNIGYLPSGQQTIRTSKVNLNTKPNLNETFYITRERAADHPDIVAGKPLVGLNRWPEDLPGFREAMLDYYGTMEALGRRMVALFAIALDLPLDYFVPDFVQPTCTLRLIRYEPQAEVADNWFGFAPHIDTNFITFLAQSNVPGLEVLTREGDWIRPPAVPGSFVVNTGEMLARYSNDRFVATPHRVINASGVRRHAIPFFIGPDGDAVIRCVPSCVTAETPAKYPPVRYNDHRQSLARTNFAHRAKPEEAMG